MRWDLLPDLSAFDRARRKEAYRRLSRVIRREPSDGLLDLDEVRHRLGVFEESYVGIRPIPVDRIIGTVGRGREFDRDFLPLQEEVRERWRRVEQAFPRGDFPPIVVYEVDGRYFVVDGHHRVAVARQREVEHIDAEITRLRTKAPLPPGADVGALILAERERLFLEETGLRDARPGVRIGFSRPDGYPELLDLLKVHAWHLSVDRGRVVSLPEAGTDWFDHVYLPTLDVIRAEGLLDLFPGASEADLFLWVYQRHRAFHVGEREGGQPPHVDGIVDVQGVQVDTHAVGDRGWRYELSVLADHLGVDVADRTRGVAHRRVGSCGRRVAEAVEV
jgi:hypothetical protein